MVGDWWIRHRGTRGYLGVIIGEYSTGLVRYTYTFTIRKRNYSCKESLRKKQKTSNIKCSKSKYLYLLGTHKTSLRLIGKGKEMV